MRKRGKQKQRKLHKVKETQKGRRKRKVEELRKEGSTDR